jgi:hypothetical protein
MRRPARAYLLEPVLHTRPVLSSSSIESSGKSACHESVRKRISSSCPRFVRPVVRMLLEDAENGGPRDSERGPACALPNRGGRAETRQRIQSDNEPTPIGRVTKTDKPTRKGSEPLLGEPLVSSLLADVEDPRNVVPGRAIASSFVCQRRLERA